jgi:hypothetical protein
MVHDLSEKPMYDIWAYRLHNQDFTVAVAQIIWNI